MVSANARADISATVVFGASVALIAGFAPFWCLGIALASTAWRLAIGFGWLTVPRPRRGLKFLFGAVTALLVVAVVLSFRTLNGLAAGTALLVVMGALKLIEVRTRRDAGIVIGVALFLLLAAALATQALWRLPFYLLIIWGACAAVALIAYPGEALKVRAALRLSGRALAMSIPLAIACFLFFPRVAGQFWALERGGQASTGLSDEMSPGSISRLANEYDPAFRVRFEGNPPARAALYWRGPVLNSFDGFTWRRERRPYTATPLELLGAPIRYRVTLEPTNQSWMFALDTVDASPRPDVFMSYDRQLSTMDRITETVSYEASSHLETRSQGELSILGRRAETRMTDGHNPRARALAREIRARTRDDAEFARAVLDWFGNNGLEYSLEPGTTTLDSVDTTLFDSKRGFCGHFASAYAMMMRSVGIPARIVTGYLGGEWNPAGGYLIVRQSDAHAWTEVWLDHSGWTRIDPTAVVAPERLQRGVFDLLDNSLSPSLSFLRNNAWLNRLRLAWDGTNQWWQERVVEFNLRSQFDLLKKLGIDSPDWQDLGWAFAGGLLLWIAWVSLALRRGVARLKPDRLGRAWLRATRRLARVAPPRAAHEGPLDYARRIGTLRPDLATRVWQLAARYAQLRFGKPARNDEIAEFEREVRRFAL